MAAARLITIEGIDGAGKTTLSTALAAELERRDIPFALLREPGGVRAAERIRELVKDPALHISPAAEALLYAAARAQLVEEAVAPLLEEGTWVLLDRFIDSSLAYQGAGRGLGVEPVRSINQFAIQGLRPDRTLLLSLDPADARARARDRGQPVDRLEGEGQDFFARIATAYAELAEQEPERIRTIDASLAPEEIVDRALVELDDLL